MEYEEGWRLACVSHVAGDVEVMVPDIASAYRSRMKMADLSSPEEIAIFEDLRRQLEEAGVRFGSDLSFLPLELSEPTLDDTMPDNERLLRAVEAATGVDESAIMLPYAVLKNLSEVLRESNFKVKCVISRDGGRILMRDVLPGDSTDPLVGFALDLGTTSLAGVLVDLESGKILAKASGGNGQIRYGADVINRIIESDKVGGRKRLQDAVIKESIIPMLASMYRSANINPRRIYRMVLAGNTTMNHLLLGLHADPRAHGALCPQLLPHRLPVCAGHRPEDEPDGGADRGPQHRQLRGRRHHGGGPGVHDLEQPGDEPVPWPLQKIFLLRSLCHPAPPSSAAKPVDKLRPAPAPQKYCAKEKSQ